MNFHIKEIWQIFKFFFPILWKSCCDILVSAQSIPADKLSIIPLPRSSLPKENRLIAKGLQDIFVDRRMSADEQIREISGVEVDLVL